MQAHHQTPTERRFLASPAVLAGWKFALLASLSFEIRYLVQAIEDESDLFSMAMARRLQVLD